MFCGFVGGTSRDCLNNSGEGSPALHQDSPCDSCKGCHQRNISHPTKLTHRVLARHYINAHGNVGLEMRIQRNFNPAILVVDFNQTSECFDFRIGLQSVLVGEFFLDNFGRFFGVRKGHGWIRLRNIQITCLY